VVIGGHRREVSNPETGVEVEAEQVGVRDLANYESG
jgi:hypothetical protein